MQISAKAWDAFIKKLRAVNEAASQKILDYMERNPVVTPLDRQALIQYAYAIAVRYGEGASALACIMYDSVAEASGVMLPAALPAASPTVGEVAKTITGTLKTGNNNIVADSIGRLVKRTGVDTTMKNAIRDGAEWAWVPRGDTCAFCITLASNGWQRASKKALKDGHAEHIHANCDCTYAVRFDGKTNVAGYDPDEYLRMYEKAPLDHWNTLDGLPPAGDAGAEKDTPKNRINAMRRLQYTENKEEIRTQQREAYARRNEFNSVLAKYTKRAKPGDGSFVISETRDPKNREEANGRLIFNQFGGNISMPAEEYTEGHKNPDYIWKGKLWEEKEPTSFTKNSISRNVREALHQISDNPGGVVLDIGNSDMPLLDVKEIVLNRFRQSASEDCDLILIRNGEVEDIWHYRRI